MESPAFEQRVALDARVRACDRTGVLAPHPRGMRVGFNDARATGSNRVTPHRKLTLGRRESVWESTASAIQLNAAAV